MKHLSVLFLILCVSQVHANDLQVPSQFATIQAALNAAQPGDSVLVASGTYNENLVWPQTNDLHLLADPSDVARPVIDGGSLGRVIDIESTGRGLLNATVAGFVITHGFLDVPAHMGKTGAGIFVSQASLQLSRCVLRENEVTSSFAIQNNGGGAGLSIVSTPAGATNEITGCQFLSNHVSLVTSGDGAAIHLDGAPAVIRMTEIRDNTITTQEVALGAIYDFASDIRLRSVKIDHNLARTTVSLPVGFAAIKGAALFSYLSKVTVIDSQVMANLSTPQNSMLALLGAAFYFYGEGTTLHISSSSIAFNSRTDGAATAGTALFFSSATAGTASIVNSIFWNPGAGDEVDSFFTRAAVHFSDIRNGMRGPGNISADPLFVSASDLHLQSASPCIAAGDNRLAPLKDLNGKSRPLPAGTNVDLGCYEIDQ